VAIRRVSCGDANTGRCSEIEGVGVPVGWIPGRWKHVLVVIVVSTIVVPTTATTAPAAADPRVPGIDVSKYQGRIDWRKVATSPLRFVIMRATLGNRYRDVRYARNVAGARKHGLVVGAYHFAKPSLARWDPRAEADHFLDVVSVGAGDILPVLDIEETGGLSPGQLRRWAAAWLDRVRARTGVRAMIYSGNYFWHGSMRNTSWFAEREHPLWVAHWYVGAPDVPGGGWAGRGYTVWQWSATGRIAGIRGPVDRDWVKGNLGHGTIASITVRPAEGGLITADRIACGGRLGWCTRLANPGDAITLRASPRAGARLIRWTGACAPAGEAHTCTVTAFRDKVVSALFGHPIGTAVPGDDDAPEASASPGDPAPARGGCDPADADCAIAALLAKQLERSSRPAADPGADPAPSRVGLVAEPTPERHHARRAGAPPDAPVRHEGERDGTRFSWSREKDRGSIGGSYRWERRGSASISFGFRGGSVTLFTVEGPRMGKARVSIDGEPVKTIDGYARRFRAGVTHRFTGLGAGPHRLTITPLGRKHRAATDRRVTVDALRWGGRLHPDPKPESMSWARVDDPSASEGGYVVSDAPGAQATLTFSGTSLTLRTLRGPAKGRAEIWVDGRRVRTIDLYARSRQFASIPIATGLADGPHIARVVVLGTHRGASEGSGVAIDRWVVAYRPERGRHGGAAGHVHG
jgi:GH25 family lysozyme M1 (1,4-beta-N-acetylmuramidase)